ncbi:hypothetical protein [Hydrogenovibrio kuenenii]|uniref:hypothetical protein n=1 Tax=Hydrogenovibrio kuenenii TaxID=63658 RepID=UPI000467E1E6|nr:hypothetical protein [Hydrogenovibrio kuenenii]
MGMRLDIFGRELDDSTNDDGFRKFLNVDVLEIELERSSAFAKRHDFWLDMIIVGLGEYASSERVVSHIAKAIELIARTEDMLFFIEDKGLFIILSLGKETEGAHIFANRVFQSIEHNKVFLENEKSVDLNIICGALSYWAGLALPSETVMQALMHQLKLAENSPKETVKYTVLDVIKQTHDDEEFKSY